MRQSKLAAIVATVGVCVFGCSAGTYGDEPASDGTAVAVDDDGLEAQDTGTSYNGWKQTVWGQHEYMGSGNYLVDWSHTLTRTFGDSTRGGGACVVRYSGGTCSSDTTCTTTAQSIYGSSAWGYCYNSACYLRTGSQASFCTFNPNRSPGTMTGAYSIPHHAVYVLGCMTKTVGPNYACGGTNTSLYMRTVKASTLFSEGE